MRGTLYAVVVVVLVVGAAAARLLFAPVVLPDVVKSRIEAALDEAMAMNRLELGTVTVSVTSGRLLEFAMRDITLTDPDGTIRAAFPAIRVAFAPSGLWQGQLRPTRIQIADAGLRLSRDADGQLDLQLTQGGAALSLEDTLERVDVMFAASDFVDLQSVTGTGLNVAMSDAMTGQVIRVREADMRLDRKNGAITLTVAGGLEGTRDARMDLAITRNARLSRTDIGIDFTNLAARDLATASPALAWLDLMRAPISGRLVTQLRDDGTIGDLSGQLEIGSGQLSIEGADAPLGIDRMAARVAYRSDTQRVTFETLEVMAPDLSFSAEGHADVGEDGTVFTGQFRLAGIEANPTGLFEAPLILEGAAIDLRLTLAPDLLVEIGQAVLVDGGQRAHGRATIRSGERGLEVAVDARLDRIGIDALLGYWPVSALPNTRRWLDENVTSADLSGIDFALRSSAGAAPRLALDLDFEGTTLRGMRTMPEIEQAAGYLSLRDRRLVMRLDAGEVTAPEGGRIGLDGSYMVLPSIGPPGAAAQISLRLQGGMQDVLRLAARPPINLFAQGPMTADRLGTGQVSLEASIDTRLQRQVPRAEVDYTVEGVIREFASDTLIPGRQVTAREVRFDIAPDAITMRGRARIDGVRFSGQWSRALGPGADPVSRVDARAALDADSLAALGLRLPEGFLSGQGTAEVGVTLVPGAVPVLEVRSDLRGVGLSVPQLGWSLPRDRAGELQATVRLGPDPAVTALTLAGGGLRLEGRVDFEGAGFGQLVADQLRVGTWLDVTGRMTSRGRGAAPAIAVTGGTLDLRGLPPSAASGGASGQASGQGGPVSVALDRLQVTDTIALTSVAGDFASAGGLSGQFTARVNGNAAVTGTLSAVDTGPAVRIRSGDGGAVLRSAGLIRNIHGGDMELLIAASGAQGTYDGQLSMNGPRVRDAPAMAELLNLISVVGLIDQLGGAGINLGEVRARFVITPRQIRLTQGDAVGPALGLSMDGAYDVARREFDMQGVISPLYAINGLFGALFAPRREGLFGFSYRLTGTPEQTNVSVNPLSILTPGIFRDIFRRPPPAPLETQ